MNMAGVSLGLGALMSSFLLYSQHFALLCFCICNELVLVLSDCFYLL